MIDLKSRLTLTAAMKTGCGYLLLISSMVGCGSEKPHCDGGTVFSVSPIMATADHKATAPGNQQQFTATAGPIAQPGCATPAILQQLKATWTVSDPVHVAISSAADATNGVATCLGTTSGAVVVTAVVDTGTSPKPNTAALTCK